MPPLSGDQIQCSTENCRRCKNKYSCLKYINYLEDIVNTPVSTIAPITTDKPAVQVDLSPLLTTLSTTLNKVSILGDNLNTLTQSTNDINAKTVTQCDELNAKLDVIINIFKKYGSPSVSAELSNDVDEMLSENGLVVYESPQSLPKGSTYFEEKKTLFGGTKMVEKTVK